MTRMFSPPHPGSVLKEALEALSLSARQFASKIGVAPSTITRILKEEGPISAEMAVRISAALSGPSPEVWLRMQGAYDIWQAEKEIDVSSIRRYALPEESQAVPTIRSHKKAAH